MIMRAALVFVAFLTLIAVAPTIASAQEAGTQAAPQTTVEAFDPSGVYGKLGFAWANSLSYDFLFSDLLGIDATSNYGVQGLVGYRWNAWLGTDVELFYATGGEIVSPLTTVGVSTSAIAGTVNARLYPIGMFQGPKRHTVEWMIDLGIGAGRYFEDTSLPLSASTFMARLGTGLDFMLGDHWSLYVDGGYYFSVSAEASGFAYLAGGLGYRF
jgi:Outer membrane protein beta-barrel domain